MNGGLLSERSHRIDLFALQEPHRLGVGQQGTVGSVRAHGVHAQAGNRHRWRVQQGQEEAQTKWVVGIKRLERGVQFRSVLEDEECGVDRRGCDVQPKRLVGKDNRVDRGGDWVALGVPKDVVLDDDVACQLYDQIWRRSIAGQRRGNGLGDDVPVLLQQGGERQLSIQSEICLDGPRSDLVNRPEVLAVRVEVVTGLGLESPAVDDGVVDQTKDGIGGPNTDFDLGLGTNIS